MKRAPTAFAVFFIAVTLAWGLLLFLPQDVEPAAVTEPAPSAWDARMIELDGEALDLAYRTQIANLFQVWMKDEHDQPKRAVNGARQARHAYIAVRTEIDRRAGESK
jgi:hypothetical protein